MKSIAKKSAAKKSKAVVKNIAAPQAASAPLEEMPLAGHEQTAWASFKLSVFDTPTQRRFVELIDPNDTLDRRLIRALLADATKLAQIAAPAGAIYAVDHIPPRVFRQYDQMHIDKVTVDVQSIVSQDKFFWWQPCNVPAFIEATAPLVKLINEYDPKVAGYNFALLQQAKPEVANDPS